MGVKRFDVYLVALDPTVGAEIQKTRPCLIISPDEMNDHIQTTMIAPMTTRIRADPSRVAVRFDDKEAQIVLDQIRTVDKRQLITKRGRIEPAVQARVLAVLAEMFAE
jgi:mRNA interferase MazF